MSQFRADSYLWIHLWGIALLPLFLEVVWLSLAIGDPFFPFWIELILLVAIGIFPIFLMQWYRPFDFFSLLLFALKPVALTVERQQILSLLKTTKQRMITLFSALIMAVTLWFIYLWSPLAATVAANFPQWRILGLMTAGVAFFFCNLFFQVPMSVLGILLTSDSKFNATEPYSHQKIAKNFIVPGFRLDRIFSL